MAKLRIQGDSTGYVDLEAPVNASSSTLDLDQVPQLNQNTTFSKESPELTIQGTTTQAHLRLESVANTSAWMISNESNADRMRIMHTNTSTSTNTFPMYIYEAGYVTMPNQPAMLAQPDSSSNVQVNTGVHIFGWNTSGGIRYNNGFGLSGSSVNGVKVFNATNTGKITVPADGKYIIYFDQRNEQTTGIGDGGAGQMGVWVNGVQMIRRHTNVWGEHPYNHQIIQAVLSLAANDTLEFGAWWNSTNGVSSPWSGTNDTVNWLYVAKIS